MSLRHLAIKLSARRVMPHCVAEDGCIDTTEAARLMGVCQDTAREHARRLGYRIAKSGQHQRDGSGPASVDHIMARMISRYSADW